MNKYADLTNRTRFGSKKMIGGLSENRVSSPKLGSLSPRERFENFVNETNNSPRISKLATSQNLILNSFSERIADEGVRRLPELNFKVVQEKEFRILIEKLDQVISPRSVCSEVMVHEGVSHEFSIEAEGVQVFKIQTRGKRCPLSVKIKTLYGNFLSIATLHEPRALSKIVYKNSKRHFHEIYDTSNEFKSEFCYICIKALSNSSFKIISEFGKHKFLSEFKNIHKHPTNEDYQESPNEVSEHKKPKKNFIRVNMDIKVLKNEDLTSRAETWESKRQEILLRKKQNLKVKKKKILNCLNNRIKRLEEEAMTQERITQKHKLLKICKDWLGIIYKTKSITHIHKLIQNKRQAFFKQVRISTKIHLIQKYFKTQIQPFSNPKVTASNNLLLFRSLTKIFQIKTIQINTCALISSVAHTNLLFHMFASFTEKIILLQRAYRRFCKKKNFRMSNLRIQWNKCMEKSLFTKKGSLRKRESLKFISVPGHVRDRALKEFYNERWKEYSKMLVGWKKGERAPAFKYFPSDVIMEGIIRSVLVRPKGS